jgi:flagellar motor switch/type III secretory pathway protein FliN
MDSPQLDRLLDLPFEVEARLPGPTLRVSQLLNLRAGSVICTAHPAGASGGVFAGNAYIGSGELYVVNGRHAVRMVQFSEKS